jgi:hypothetical protein
LALVDSVSADDMNSVCSTKLYNFHEILWMKHFLFINYLQILSGGKLTMAVFGNVSNVPYLDQLK